MSTEDADATGLDEHGRLVIRRHAAVTAVAHDPVTFSNRVSVHVHVPNGLDGTEHTEARRVLDPFLAPAAIEPLAPDLARIARRLIAELGASGESFDGVHELGARYAVRAQSAWLGWDDAWEGALLAWVVENRAASRSRDPERMRRVAEDFDAIVASLVAERRVVPRDDVTTRLMTTPRADGRPFDQEELVSVLRNWTGGDLSSLALCAGVVVHWLARHPEHAGHLAAASDADLDAAIDEILRQDDPFVSNRRIATRDTVVDGCPVVAGSVVVLDWRAANGDPAAFADPAAFDPHGHADANLVYGTGPHACPGRALSTLELRVLVRELLAAGMLELDPRHPPTREEPPVAGFRTVHVRIVPPAG
jgi:cytochrome P450